MIISCMGHAKFVIELDNGLRIVTDPYDASCGYPVTANPADVVLVSHQHHDHNAVETIPGHPRVIDRAGDFDLGGGAAVRAIEAYHDEQQGKLRGKTLLFCLKAEGLTVMHLGDLGHMLTTEQRLLLGSADIVMLPVGGYYTMDAPMAKQVADVLHARVILPMHYRRRRMHRGRLRRWRTSCACIRRKRRSCRCCGYRRGICRASRTWWC